MTVDLIILLYFGLAPFLSSPTVQSVMWIIGSLF